jgi:hypothetical protein
VRTREGWRLRELRLSATHQENAALAAAMLAAND